MLTRHRAWRTLALVVLACLIQSLAPAALLAQKKDANSPFVRSNPKFVAAFRDVVSKVGPSTVRIQCDGKDTALGVVVGAEGFILTKASDLKGKIVCKVKASPTQDTIQDYEAKIVGVHEPHDLALLKIEAMGLRPVEWANSKVAAVGHWVASAGPNAEPVAVGVVSVATRNLPPVKGPAVTPNPNGGYLGISLEAGDGGVKIMQVLPNTPASKAGFKVNDIVLTLAGKKVAQPDEFMALMQKHRPGDQVTLKIKRGDEETELKATLTKRPVARGDMQNNMGSELSQRKTGFPVILQHDSVVKPSDCGSPLVDLEGRVVGLNICRWGRVETYAVPSEAVQKVLPDLIAGKLPPKSRETPAAAKDAKDEKKQEKKSGTATEEEIAVDGLLQLVHQRLLLMPDVARAKWNAGTPIADPEREQAFLKAMVAKSPAHGLDPEFTRSFFRRAA